MLTLLIKEEQAISSSGQLHLIFEQIRNRTRLIDCYQAPPLKASRTIYNGGDQKATVFLMESSGGMVAGDSNEYRIHVKKAGSVCLKPQSATKIYPSYNHRSCSQTISIILEEKAELEWNREEIIPYKDASFHGTSSIQMSSSSTLLWGEILYPGREKSGEQYQFEELNTHLEVWVDEHCIVYDTLKIKPTIQNVKGIGVLEHYNYIGSFWFISPKVEKLNETILQKELIQTEEHQSGISRLNGNGIVVRWLTNNLPLLKVEMDHVFQKFKVEKDLNDPFTSRNEIKENR